MLFFPATDVPNRVGGGRPSRRLPVGFGVWLVVGLLVGTPGCRVQTPAVPLAPFDAASSPAGVTDAFGRLMAPAAGGRRAGPGPGVRVPSDAEYRRAAAETLLATEHPAAWSALSAAIGPDAPTAARRAVLRSMATATEVPDAPLWRPLAALLEHPVPAELALDLGAALGRFDRVDLRAHLVGLAQDPARPPSVRRQVIDALAHQRDREVAAALLGLTSRTELPRVQAAAFAALGALAARDDLGQDRRAWDAWWERASRQSRGAWQRELIDSFARRRAVRRQNEARLAQRLNVVERAYYNTTAKPGRPAVLTAMLESPLRDSRLLALELTQNLMVGDADLDEPLRAALRARLADQNADVRARAALVLRDAADESAADIAAARLIDGSESVDVVRSAYLRLLARLPRKEATPGVLALLDDPVLRADAAGALSATSRALLLAPRQAAEAQRRLRQLLTPQPTVGPDGLPVPAPAPMTPGPDSPQLVTLLGQVGDSADWIRIERWLDDPDPVIKQAAAQAWADLGRSLPTLADRAADPVILPIVLQAAERGGQDGDTLRQLAAFPPPGPRLLPAWERALVAMAGRVPPVDVRPVLAVLGTNGSTPGIRTVLRERILTAALEREVEDGESRADYLDLRLRRAQSRLASNQADLAVSDYEKLLVEIDLLSPAQGEAVYRGLVPACLAAGRHEDALQAVKDFLVVGERPVPEDPLLLQRVDAGLRATDLGRPGVGVDLHEGVLQLLAAAAEDAPQPAELAERLARLEASLAPPKREP